MCKADCGSVGRSDERENASQNREEGLKSKYESCVAVSSKEASDDKRGEIEWAGKRPRRKRRFQFKGLRLQVVVRLFRAVRSSFEMRSGSRAEGKVE